MPVILATWEAEIRRPTQASSSQDPISIITRAKWAGCMGQAVELPGLQVQSPEFKFQSHKRNK
jgi:hypothetical protein